MRAIVSVGWGDDLMAVTELVSRLQFSSLEGKLVRVLERFQTAAIATHPALSEDILDRYVQMQELEELEKLASVQSRFSRQGLKFATELKQGISPANILIELCDNENPDLVVVGCREKSFVEKVVSVGTGSVTRKLANHAKENILVCRNVKKSTGKVNAVLATDHSSFGQSCIESLVQFAPQGIGQLTIMTAYAKEFVEQIIKFQDNIHLDVTSWIESELHKKNEELAKTLAPLNCECVSRVVGLAPEEAIAKTMEETGSELLIMGSQGHGFLERMSMGSLSFDQIVSGQYSVMVLRNTQAPAAKA